MGLYSTSRSASLTLSMSYDALILCKYYISFENVLNMIVWVWYVFYLSRKEEITFWKIIFCPCFKQFLKLNAPDIVS